MDVHPPLAKMLITLAGWLAGFDGEFDFKEIGKDYIEPGVPYVAMRLFPAIIRNAEACRVCMLRCVWQVSKVLIQMPSTQVK